MTGNPPILSMTITFIEVQNKKHPRRHVADRYQMRTSSTPGNKYLKYRDEVNFPYALKCDV